MVGALFRKAFQAFLNLELNDKSILNSHLLKMGTKKKETAPTQSLKNTV
jgi:hypothetical protein